MQIAIIGAGDVGGALGRGWARAGHAITYGVPDPSEARHRATAQTAGSAGLLPVPQAVQGADAIVLAVPFDAVGDALKAAGDLTGRLLIDVTNPLRMGAAGLELSIGFDRSAAEHVASLTPGAAVFKTLNQVGFEVMESTAGYVAPPVMFVAGDDATRKPVVMALVSDLGFHAVDAGGLAPRGCWSRTACCGFTWRSTARPVVTTPLPTLFGARVRPDWIAVRHRRKSSGFGCERILQDLARR